jgi:hypothetical protein
MKKLWGKDKTEAALERLDRLTKDEGLSAAAQTLGVVHGIADDMRVASNETNRTKRLLFVTPLSLPRPTVLCR